MTDPANSKLVARLQKHRQAVEGGDFPIYDSLIGYSLFLLLCHYELRGITPRLKDIYLELERSQGGVRRLVKALMADGWITITKAEGDQRSRYVCATPKLKHAVAKFVGSIHSGI